MKKHLLLINPAINQASQSSIVNDVINKTFPTSLGVLAGFIINKQLSLVNIVDEQLELLSEQSLSAEVQQLDSPRVIGISALTINSTRGYELAGMVKRIDPNCLVVIGGIHPTVLPEEALSQPGIDVVVRGEGEETLSQLLELHLDGKPFHHIEGISRLNNGRAVHNPPRALIEDLDQIPPFPYNIFGESLRKYPTFGTVMSSRGCPYNCIFCSSRSITGNRNYRFHSVERVLSEIETLIERYGQSEIWIMDDNIAVNRTRFMQLTDGIITRGFHRKCCFHGSMRGDNATPELLRKMKEANFKMIGFGLETSSERLMKMIDKGETVEQVRKAILMAAEAGLSVATTLIFGIPGETRADRYHAMRFVNELPVASVRFNTLTPYPGTPSFEVARREGDLRIHPGWSNFAVQYMWEGDEIPYVPVGTSRIELIFDTMYANLRFYLSVSGIRRMLKSSYAGGNVVKLSGAWFLSPKTMWRMTRLGFFLGKRFCAVSAKYLWERLGNKFRKKASKSVGAEQSGNDLRISKDVQMGRNVKLFSFVNLYGCFIGDDTKIGTFVEVQKGARIGSNCKISSHTFVCEGVTIEDNCFIGHGVMFINDNHPQSVDSDGTLENDDVWRNRFVKTLVKRNVSIGTGCTILGGVTIGENALIGAGSVLTKDVPANEIWCGNPARKLSSKNEN